MLAHTVVPFGDTRQMFRLDPDAVVLHVQQHIALRRGILAHRQADPSIRA